MALYSQVDEENLREMQAGLPASSQRPGHVWPPREAHSILAEIHDHLDGLARELVQSMTSYEWLWYLRRLPPEIFARRFSMGGPYDWTIAETLSGYSNARGGPSETSNRVTNFPLTEKRLRLVLKLVSITWRLSKMQKSMRRAAKGLSYIGDPRGFPEAVDNAEVDPLIELLDKRVEADFDHGYVEEVRPMNFWTPESSQHPILTVGLVSFAWTQVEGWIGPLHDEVIVPTYGRYGPSLQTLDALEAMVRESGAVDDAWWERPLPSLVVLLNALATHIHHLHPVSGRNIPRVGYSSWPLGELRGFLDDALPVITPKLRGLFGRHVPATTDEVLDLVDSISPSTLPVLAGPVFRWWGAYVVIDLYTASGRLWEMATIPSHVNRHLVQARGTTFEIAVQTMIDATPWKPSSRAPHRDLKLKRANGSAITNVDARADYDDTLLIVECKGYPYTHEIDAGFHRQVENRRQELEQDVLELDAKLAELRANPVGRNYDFSYYTEVIGVVATQHAFYVTSTEALRIVRESRGNILRGACTIGELHRFMHSFT